MRGQECRNRNKN